MAKNDPAAMTPSAAVARHLEWLQFALAAARDEEARRRERLARATNKNREKRTVRLAEVTAEVLELGALVKGLQDLPARPAIAATAGRRRTSTAKPKSSRASRPKTAAAASGAATPSATPTATPKAASTPKAAAAAKPAATARKPATRRAASSAAKPVTPRARKPATRRRTRKPPAPPA